MKKRISPRRARIVLFAIVATLTLTPASACAATGLASEWLLDEGTGAVARDTSGAGLDGQLGTGAALPRWVFGLDGLGLHFDGDDEVLVPDSTALEPPRLTVEAWVRNAGTPGAFRYVVSKGSTGCSTSSYGIYTGSAQGLAFYVNGPSGYVVSPQARAAAVWDGSWHHAVGTYDGVTVRMFIDGNEIGSGRPAPSSIAYGLPSKSLRLGTYRGDCELPYTGDIDAVRIWNLALTQTEVAQAPETPRGRPQPAASTPRPGTAAPSAGSSAAPDCLTLAPGTKRVRVGRRTTLTATVRKGGRRAARVRVVLTGKGIRRTTRRTDSNGRVRFVVRPHRKTVLRLRAYGTLPKCGAPVANVPAS